MKKCGAHQFWAFGLMWKAERQIIDSCYLWCIATIVVVHSSYSGRQRYTYTLDETFWTIIDRCFFALLACVFGLYCPIGIAVLLELAGTCCKGYLLHWNLACLAWRERFGDWRCILVVHTGSEKGLLTGWFVLSARQVTRNEVLIYIFVASKSVCRRLVNITSVLLSI